MPTTNVVTTTWYGRTAMVVPDERAMSVDEIAKAAREMFPGVFDDRFVIESPPVKVEKLVADPRFALIVLPMPVGSIDMEQAERGEIVIGSWRTIGQVLAEIESRHGDPKKSFLCHYENRLTLSIES